MSLKRECRAGHRRMGIDLNHKKRVALEQLREFLAGAAHLDLTAVADPGGHYGSIEGVLKRFKDPLLGKADHEVVRR